MAQQKGFEMDLDQLIKDLHKVEEYLHKGFVELAEDEIDYIINDAQSAQQGVQWTLLESGEKIGTCPTCAHVHRNVLPESQSH